MVAASGSFPPPLLSPFLFLIYSTATNLSLRTQTQTTVHRLLLLRICRLSLLPFPVQIRHVSDFSFLATSFLYFSASEVVFSQLQYRLVLNELRVSVLASGISSDNQMKESISRSVLVHSDFTLRGEKRSASMHLMLMEMTDSNYLYDVILYHRDLERLVKVDLQKSQNELATSDQQKSDDKMLKLVYDQKQEEVLRKL
ncbi:unnamed protein product [Lactuca virosa]|uniref:Uncharacterized protein n=1 Tax=Lactuca virosa TaxID=75947 RepID=A0AAU9N9S1_9ASTR|nr:unnamed protein product [Lactuca virosa]